MQTPTALCHLEPLAPQAPLDTKIARARLVLEELLNVPGLDPSRIAVAFTGGKDSGVALFFWRLALATAGRGPLRAISVDTGFKFPQVTAFRDELAEKWGVELTLARPGVDLARYPVGQDKLACCRDLKIGPLHAAMRGLDIRALITGIRRDEHPSRAERPYVEERGGETEPAHWQVNPLLDWTELDIWAFITGQGLPYCALYHEGYRSLGCMPCTTKCEGCELGSEGERAGRDQDKESQMEALKSLGYF